MRKHSLILESLKSIKEQVNLKDKNGNSIRVGDIIKFTIGVLNKDYTFEIIGIDNKYVLYVDLSDKTKYKMKTKNFREMIKNLVVSYIFSNFNNIKKDDNDLYKDIKW